MKKSLAYLFILPLIFLLSCDKMDNEKSDVYGDAVLKIVNECEYRLTIYFDSVNLGEVEKNGERSWNVLPGNHTIKATCLGADAYEEEHVFTDNQITELHLDIVFEKSRQLSLSYLH